MMPNVQLENCLIRAVMILQPRGGYSMSQISETPDFYSLYDLIIFRHTLV